MSQTWESEPGDVETKIIPHIQDADLKLFFKNLKQNELFINYNITYYVRTESFRSPPIKKSSIYLKFKPDLERAIENVIIITLNEPAPSNESGIGRPRVVQHGWTERRRGRTRKQDKSED